MKLSKAQMRAIENAKNMIAEARAYETFEEYEGEHDSYAKGRGGVDYVKAHIDYYEKYREYWENYRQGIVLCNAGKNTIDALVKMGIFEIVKWDEMRHCGVIDWVKYNEDWEA